MLAMEIMVSMLFIIRFFVSWCHCKRLERTIVSSSCLQWHQLTKKRIINSIDTTVNIDSYNLFPIPGNLKTYERILKVGNNKKHDVIRNFQNFSPRGNVGRNNRQT